MNFTHRIDEFSFGNLYPALVNPLDNSIEIAETSKWGGRQELVHYIYIWGHYF